MAWTIEFDSTVEKELKKIGKQEQKDILNYLKNRISPSEDPRLFGKPLRGNMSGFWRYRVGNYRIICKIHQEQIQILVIRIAHRRHVYH